MNEQRARELLAKARSHLQKVQTAAWPPTDYDDLALYGFYCLEAAVMAAGTGLGWQIRPLHQEKVTAAVRLHKEHHLPNVSTLLPVLNNARKAAAYGDTPWPKIDPEDLAADIEGFVEAVSNLLDGLFGTGAPQS